MMVRTIGMLMGQKVEVEISNGPSCGSRMITPVWPWIPTERCPGSRHNSALLFEFLGLLKSQERLHTWCSLFKLFITIR